jgi:Asp-tRNA(Asn)/Glu-tRNA(Gln) amidotransferase A subunit family amidase
MTALLASSETKLSNPFWPPRKLATRSFAGTRAGERSIGFTSLFNAPGHPAASLPLHWSAQGLPVGLQIIAQFGDEATIFRLAAQIETTGRGRIVAHPGWLDPMVTGAARSV